MKKIFFIVLFFFIFLSSKIYSEEKIELICMCASEKFKTLSPFFRKSLGKDLLYYEKGCETKKIIIDVDKKTILLDSTAFKIIKFSDTVFKGEIENINEFFIEKNNIIIDRYTGELKEQYSKMESNTPNNVATGFLFSNRKFDCRKRDKLF